MVCLFWGTGEGEGDCGGKEDGVGLECYVILQRAQCIGRVGG
jgi:hypothetical protein